MTASFKTGWLCIALATCWGVPVFATDVYQAPEAFLAEVFPDGVPEPTVIWLTGERKTHATRILGHPPESLRTRFWRDGERTAWILNEIGKERPITVGLVVNNDRLEKIRVLVYRESRGAEIRFPFFTEQFTDAAINETGILDRQVDNITGATMSVNAMKRLASLALFLHAESRR